MSSPNLVFEPTLGRRRYRPRRGAVAVKMILMMPALLAFMALSVDTGIMVDEKTKLQSAVDAAALAAAGEIVAVVDAAGEEGTGEVDVNSLAVEQARDMAVQVAAENGVFIDGQRDVRFGKSQFNEQTATWEVEWGVEPYNVVQVSARRDDSNPTPASSEDPDGRALSLPFGAAIGHGSHTMSVSATAFVESRDIVVVMDFSRSMTYDSALNVSRLSDSDVIDNEWAIYQALGSPDLGPIITPASQAEFDGEIWYQETRSNDAANITLTVKFMYDRVEATANRSMNKFTFYYYDGYGNSNTKTLYTSGPTVSFYSKDFNGNGRRVYKVAAYDNYGNSRSVADYDYKDNGDYSALDEKEDYFGLSSIPYPYPVGSWEGFLKYCRYEYNRGKAGYEYGDRMYYTGRKFRYTAAAFVNYLIDRHCYHSYTPELADAPVYPFHAVKNGTSLFLGFLDNLDFGDAVGIVAYAEHAKVMDQVPFCSSDYRYSKGNCPPGHCDVSADVSAEPISKDYAALDAIQRHTQAGHFSWSTAMGDGLVIGKQLLDDHARYGSRKTILLMTDGNANVCPSTFSAPEGFDWSKVVKKDGSPYYTSDNSKKYAIYKAWEAIENGCTIHTMSVGADADHDIMEVIAVLGKGIHMKIEGGETVADLESELLEEFNRIAAKVPPPRLIKPVDAY